MMCRPRSRISLRQPADLRIDHRLAAADGDDRRAALVRRRQALLDRHDFVDRGFVLADAAAARAGQVAGVQRLEHHHHRKFLRAAKALAWPHTSRDSRSSSADISFTLLGLLPVEFLRAAPSTRRTERSGSPCCGTAPARTAENNSGTNDISDKTRTGNPVPVNSFSAQEPSACCCSTRCFTARAIAGSSASAAASNPISPQAVWDAVLAPLPLSAGS